MSLNVTAGAVWEDRGSFAAQGKGGDLTAGPAQGARAQQQLAGVVPWLTRGCRL